jgi:hypothetical protein
MCLSEVYYNKKDKLKKFPNEITVYKSVYVENGKNKAPLMLCDDHYYPEGLYSANTIKEIRAGDGIYYQSGFHCFLKKSDAFSFLPYSSTYKVIKCKVKKEHISAIGKQSHFDLGDTVIVSQMVFPEYGKYIKERAIGKCLRTLLELFKG